jgi:hypothetical protein
VAIREYLHEKAAESRHNEMSAYLMFIAGAVFYVGGVLETLTITSLPDWFLIFPYKFTSNPSSFLGLALTLCGITLLVYGLAAGTFYAHDRAWYMKELYKAHSFENSTGNQKKRRSRNSTTT